MAEIKDLSTTDANNTGTAANAGFPENMAYSDVNNAARALEGMIARHFADSNGTLTTTGSSNAYLLTPNRTVSAYAAGDAYMIKASFTNTGAVTINVSSLGAKSIVKPSGDALAAGELTSGGIYAIIYDGTNFQMAGADDPENLTLTSLTVTGATALNGNTTIGDAATDTVTITADVASDLIPSADGTHDLGAVGSEWQDLFIDGTANIDSLVADTADIDAGTIDGTVIGGNSAAAITGTTLVANTSLNIASDGATVTGIKDEDDMASDSATKLATQQSIKAYVDSQVTAQDLDFQADSGGALSVDLDSQTFTLTGGTGIDTSGSGQTVTFDIDSTVATLTGSQTLTNKTLTSPVLDTGVSGTAILDEDNMASNSATQLATQQSIKTYVDNQLTAEDLDFQADSGGALSVDLDSQTFTLTGGTGIDTVGANQTVTFNIDSTVATLTGTQTLTNKTLTSPVLNTGVSGTAVLDEDNMASDSATKLATQQSIKAYVDAQITAEDLDFQADSGGALSIDLDSETLTFTGGTGIDTSGSGNAVTFDIDSTVATLTGTQTLTNKTLTSPDINTPDIDGGTIDGAVIGGSSAAAGSFTTGSFSSDVSFADSSKAIFGTGGDGLEIYHNGSNSFIDDAGTGNLQIRANAQVKIQKYTGENMFVGIADGAASMYYDNVQRIATTSTGCQVTGSVTADTLETSTASGGLISVIRNDPTIGTNNSLGAIYWKSTEDSGTTVNIGAGILALADQNHSTTASGSRLSLQTTAVSSTSPTERLRIGATGDISFYDGSGNAGFFWDSSKASVGIGTTGLTPTDGSNIELSSATSARVILDSTGTGGRKWTMATGTSGSLDFYDYDASAYRLRIDASGFVGINRTSPSGLLHIQSDAGSNAQLYVQTGDTSTKSQLIFGDSGDSNTGGVQYDHSDDSLQFHVGNVGEKMRLSSDALIVGTTDSATYNFESGGGTALWENGLVAAAKSGAVVGIFNRTSSDGDILQFRKNGSAVGSIGVVSADRMYFSTADGLGLQLDKDNSRIVPVGADGSTFNNNVSLGSSGLEFKNLYLSGNATHGTTPSSSAAGIKSEAVGRTTYSRGSAVGGFGHLIFINGNGTVGSVTTSGSATAYNTSSDYRLKENVSAMTQATERLKQLLPKRFNFIADADTTVDGFLAHEVADVVPEAITGTKDGMRDEEYEVKPAVLDDDGNVVDEAVMGTRSVPDYQGIDQSKLVPLLVATIQELEARITQLENN